MADLSTSERALGRMRRQREWHRGWVPAPGVSDRAAAVMATGAISIAAGEESYHLVGLLFGLLAGAGFAVVTAAALCPGRSDPQGAEPDRTLRAFSLVAAGALLATRWQHTVPALGWILAVAAGSAWLALAARAVHALAARSITELCRQARGRWLLAAVAPQSLAIAAAGSVRGLTGSPVVAVVAFGCWVLGMIAYLGLVALIAARASTSRALPAGPDAWILMGALAIATVAASAISATAPVGPGCCAGLARSAIPVLWVLASGWIPVLLAGHLRRLLHALRHDAARWAAVFPLGMYSIASARLADDLHRSALRPVALVFFWVALAAWSTAAMAPRLSRPTK